MDGDLCQASPRRGTLFCVPGGALTLIAGRWLQRSQDPTIQISIVTLDANLIHATAPRRVAADPGVRPSASRRGPFQGALANRYPGSDEARVMLGARGAIIYV